MASFINKKPGSRMEPFTSASKSEKEPSLRFSELRRAEEEQVEQICLDPVASSSRPDGDPRHPENRVLSSSSSTDFQSRSEDTDVEEVETSSKTTQTSGSLEDTDGSQTFEFPEDFENTPISYANGYEPEQGENVLDAQSPDPTEDYESSDSEEWSEDSQDSEPDWTASPNPRTSEVTGGVAASETDIVLGTARDSTGSSEVQQTTQHVKELRFSTGEQIWCPDSGESDSDLQDEDEKSYSFYYEEHSENQNQARGWENANRVQFPSISSAQHFVSSHNDEPENNHSRGQRVEENNAQGNTYGGHSIFLGRNRSEIFGNYCSRNTVQEPNDCLQRGWLQTCIPQSSRVPKIPKPHFDGHSSYHQFVNQFHSYVGNKQAPEEDKFAHLLDCLSGQPRRMMDALAAASFVPGFLEEAFTILQKRYVGSQRIDILISRKIKELPCFEKSNLDNVVAIMSVLEEIYFQVRHRHGAGTNDYFSNQIWIVSLIQPKLPREEQVGYVQELTRNGQEENFLTLRDYLAWRYEQFLLLEPYLRDQSSDEIQSSLGRNRIQHEEIHQIRPPEIVYKKAPSVQNCPPSRYGQWTEVAETRNRAVNFYQAWNTTDRGTLETTGPPKPVQTPMVPNGRMTTSTPTPITTIYSGQNFKFTSFPESKPSFQVCQTQDLEDQFKGTWRKHCPAEQQATPMIPQETEPEPFPLFKPEASVTSMTTLSNSEAKQEAQPVPRVSFAEKLHQDLAPEHLIQEDRKVSPPEEFQGPTALEQALKNENQVLQKTLRTLEGTLQKQEQKNQVLVAYLLRRVSDLSLENQSLRDRLTLETPPDFKSEPDLSASEEQETSSPESSQEFPNRWTSEGGTSESNSSEINGSFSRPPKSWWGEQDEERDVPETGKVSSSMDPPLTRFKNSPDQERFCKTVSGNSNQFLRQTDSAFGLPNLQNSSKRTESPTMPKTSPAIEKIQEIRQEVNLLFSKAARFQGIKEDQDYQKLEEQLLQKQVFIDKIETGGCEKIQRMRKNLTRQIFSCLGLLDRRATPEEDVSTPTEKSDDKFDGKSSFRPAISSDDHSRVDGSQFSTTPQDKRFVSGQRTKKKRKKSSWAN